jgi:hypothetical protein
MSRVRWRISTLALLVVIVALSLALVVQDQRARRREAELSARLAEEMNEAQRLYSLVDHLRFRSANSQGAQVPSRPAYPAEP